MVSKECACSACDPSVILSVPSIGFVYVFGCRKLTPHLSVCSPYVVSLLILHYMWSGKSQQLLCIFPFGML